MPFQDSALKLDDKQVVPYVNAAIGLNIEPKHIVGAFQKQFYYQWIDSILSGNSVLSAFNRISQDKAIRTFPRKILSNLKSIRQKSALSFPLCAHRLI